MRKFKDSTKHTFTVRDKKGKILQTTVFYQEVKTGKLFDEKGKEIKEMMQ